MLSRAYRLKKQAEFARVLQGGRKTRGQHLLLFFLPVDQPLPRLGIIISKKVAKLATERNHIRRSLSHLAAPILKNWGQKPTGDMVALVTKVPENLATDLQQDLDQWLKQQ